MTRSSQQRAKAPPAPDAVSAAPSTHPDRRSAHARPPGTTAGEPPSTDHSTALPADPRPTRARPTAGTATEPPANNRLAGGGAPGRRGQPARPSRAKTASSPRTSPAGGLATRRQAQLAGRILAEAFPDAHCELDFESPLQLLVATVLSAQCTDERVNRATPALFAAFPDAAAYAAASQDQLEELIRSLGLFRAKAQALKGIGAALVERFGGEVPGTLEELVTLPGVGRKTANVVLGNAFGVPGITVDTHVGRVARRLGWTTQEDAGRVEDDIGQLFDAEEWTMLSHRLIFQGRRVCHARKPACGDCALAALCPSAGGVPTRT